MNADTRAVNIPPGVLMAALAMAALHILRLSLPDEQGLAFLLTMAFIPARYAGVVIDIPGGDWASLTSFVTYMFVHGDWTHLIVNLLWMLAFGSAVARRIGTVRFLLFSALCGIAGVLLHLVLHFGEAIPVVGASAAISGQMAGAVRFVFGGRPPGLDWSRSVETMPLASVSETLANGRFLLFLGVWVMLNLLFGLGGVQLDTGTANIAWEAHIGGFLCGLFAFGAFDRQGQNRSTISLD